ncbi:MAG: hypothetical protein IKL76_00220, partial [Clostridia bacterium]|nr:hypothetical protein [Clostridia bacterium]
MKKRLGLLLLSLTCGLATACAVACSKEPEKQNTGVYTLSFTDGEGFSYKLVGEEQSSDLTTLSVN